MRAFVAALALAACGKPAPASAPAAAPAAAPAPAAAAVADRTACEPMPFAASIPLAEASGAAFVPEGLLVVADSGNHGAYLILDPDTGDVRERGQLPLPAGTSDDIEGISTPDQRTIYGLVSDGTLLAWTRAEHGYELLVSARVGDARDKNYEGLCLAPSPKPGACEGYAASKADGRLWCLDALRVVADRLIQVARPEQLADCGYAPDGATLYAGGNVFAADMVWQIDPATGDARELGLMGPGNGEVVVAGPGGVIYRFSDLNTAPSLAGKFRCTAAAR